MAKQSTLRKYSHGERLLLCGVFVALASFFVWMAYGLLQTSWQTYVLDQRFVHEGVQTQGFVSGFRHVTFEGKYATRSTGQYPIVTIETPKGVFQIPTSYAHPLNKAQQDKLLWQKVDVVYLRDEPQIGRVVKWHGSSMWVLTGLGIFLLVVALFSFSIIFRIFAFKNNN